MSESRWAFGEQLGRRLLDVGVKVLLLATVALSACGQSPYGAPNTPAASSSPVPSPAATAAPVEQPGATVVQPTAPNVQPTAAAANTYSNPVYPYNFPDPFVLAVDGVYYAYATGDATKHYQTLTSKDLVSWEEGPDAMPQFAAWVTGDSWAPEVLRHSDGRYIMYYTAHSLELDKQCIGVATSDKPLGPYVDSRTAPLVCQVDEGGSIDANPFRNADGKLYLLWKNDGNCCGLPTYIYSQRLSADGTKLTGKPVRLVQNDAAWEGPLVEAPTLWRRDNRYYLFFSANAYYDETYAVGYAACKGPLGPCKDAPENPILSTEGEAVGPGHQAMIELPGGKTYFIYHAWPHDAVGSTLPGRVPWVDEVVWRDGRPVVQGPTSGPQPIP